MPLVKGTKIAKGVGAIRVICQRHKHTTINAPFPSKRQLFPIESSGRMNCCYCNDEARYISIPENIRIIVEEPSYA